MKAIRVTPPIDVRDLAPSDLPLPEPGEGEVRLRMRAAGLNHRELQGLAGTWKDWGTYILGSDGAGVVEATGPGVPSTLVGQDVVIYPGLNWGPDNRRPQPQFKVIGGPTDGCFAEVFVTRTENVLPRPAYLSWEEAATLAIAGLTAYRGLVARARVTAADTVLIHGIGGGVALAGLQIAHALGARTIVTSSSDEKLVWARAIGADDTINYRAQDWRRAATDMTNGEGPDVVLDGIGGDTLTQSVATVRRGGRVVSLGVTDGPARDFPIRPLYQRHVDLLGTSLGSRGDFSDMLDFYARHRLRPVIHAVYSLDDIATAMETLQRGAQFGKIALRIGAN